MISSSSDRKCLGIFIAVSISLVLKKELLKVEWLGVHHQNWLHLIPAMAAMSFCLLMFIRVFAFTPSSSACLEVLEELEEVLGCWGMRGWVKELLPREGGWEGGLEGGMEGREGGKVFRGCAGIPNCCCCI